MKSRHNLNQRAIEEALWLGVRFDWIGIVLFAMGY